MSTHGSAETLVDNCMVHPAHPTVRKRLPPSILGQSCDSRALRDARRAHIFCWLYSFRLSFRNNCIRATWNTVCEFITSNLVDHKAVEFRGLKTTWPESKKAEVALPDVGSVYFTVFFASETTVI